MCLISDTLVVPKALLSAFVSICVNSANNRARMCDKMSTAPAVAGSKSQNSNSSEGPCVPALLYPTCVTDLGGLWADSGRTRGRIGRIDGGLGGSDLYVVKSCNRFQHLRPKIIYFDGNHKILMSD